MHSSSVRDYMFRYKEVILLDEDATDLFSTMQLWKGGHCWKVWNEGKCVDRRQKRKRRPWGNEVDVAGSWPLVEVVLCYINSTQDVQIIRERKMNRYLIISVKSALSELAWVNKIKNLYMTLLENSDSI